MEYPTDDGLPWGFIAANGAWVPLPKTPLLLAELGPPPFDVILPSGAVRHVVHQLTQPAPRGEGSDLEQFP